MKTLTKCFITVFFASLFFATLHSQTERSFAVTADKMNLLYFGMENPVSIAVTGVPADKLKVSAINGSIIGSDGKYIVRPENKPYVIIEVFEETDAGELEEIGCDTFRVRRIPSPVACIGLNCNSDIYLTKEELLKNPEINIIWPMPVDMKFEIESFSFSCLKDQESIELQANGNKFTGEMLAMIRDLPAGSKILIQNIQANCPDGKRRLSSISVSLVE